MSARALLLSPDDQAVSAITGVLEELSVMCERPRDGATAAQKLNSQTYDLVLVDCDNLPAAKLIFDVCRRSHAGTTIPIAIVDGRAGLPTAFRLGAELILTKPVAKDQARTTIRTAVSRLRKDEPARAAHPIEPAPLEAPALSIPETFAHAATAGAASAAAPVPVVTTPVASAKPAELSTVHAPVADVPEAVSTPEQLPPPSVKIPETLAPSERVPRVFNDTAVAPPKAPSKLLEESVLEELTKAETELHTPITFSSYDQSKKRKKVRGPLVAMLLLGMMTAAFYAAWMQLPEFRTMVQPQLNKAMSMVGLVPTQQTVAPAPVVQQPVAKASVSQTPIPTQSAPSVATPAPGNAPQPAPASTSTAATTTETASPAAVLAKATTTASDESEKSPETAKKTAASAPEAELPWEKETVILSSKGAEKRLVHHVQPAFPREARAQKADGTVVLKTLVGGNGSVAGIRVVEGNPALATAATKAVKQWRYKPYIRDGSRTSFQTIVIVDFQQP